MQNYYRNTNLRLKLRKSNSSHQRLYVLAMTISSLLILLNVCSETLLRADRFQHLFTCLAITLIGSAILGKGKGALVFLFITILGLGKELTDHQMEGLDLVANYSGWLLALLLILAMTALTKTNHQPLKTKVSY